MWLDNSTKPNWPVTDPVPLMLSPNGRSLRTAPAAWAETKRQARLAPDGKSLPVEWDELPVDEKYNQSYVTMALLKRQQETIMQELKKSPDITKVSGNWISLCIWLISATYLIFNQVPYLYFTECNFFKSVC